MTKHMEIAEQVYKRGTPYKITTESYANRASNVSKRKGREAASTTYTEKGRDVKFKKNHAGHLSDCPTGDKTCLVHGPVHST